MPRIFPKLIRTFSRSLCCILFTRSWYQQWRMFDPGILYVTDVEQFRIGDPSHISSLVDDGALEALLSIMSSSNDSRVVDSAVRGIRALVQYPLPTGKWNVFIVTLVPDYIMRACKLERSLSVESYSKTGRPFHCRATVSFDGHISTINIIITVHILCIFSHCRSHCLYSWKNCCIGRRREC